MAKALLFHIFPINNWKVVSENLLSRVPHEDIFVHVSLSESLTDSQTSIEYFLSSFEKIRQIFYSHNSAHAEVDAMEVFRTHVNFSGYSLLTYMHTKGVTKPDDYNVKDWIELMRYFIIDKMSTCIDAFDRGYLMYGVNKTVVQPSDKDFAGAEFFYAGNFVSVKLTQTMIERIKTIPLPKAYYGLEGFWGKLCDAKFAYNAFHSRINHYLVPFPAHHYKTRLARIWYSAMANYYHMLFGLKRYLNIKNLNE